jgi:hypothetical protein
MKPVLAYHYHLLHSGEHYYGFYPALIILDILIIVTFLWFLMRDKE